MRYKAKDFNVHPCRRCLEISTDFTERVENISVGVAVQNYFSCIFQSAVQKE